MEKEKELLKTNRAWIEIDFDNLKHNIKVIKEVIPSHTKIMAVVKANAYGHGIIEISKALSKMGIHDFAVATIKEGITLRKNGIKDNILILGSTSVEVLPLVIKYNLIQTIVDYNYANLVSKLKLKKKLKCHLKINTGMNRLGEDPKNISKIIAMYQNPQLEVQGIFTHLCVSDSSKVADIKFTNEQINRFDFLIASLKKNNINPGKTHVQASYGIVNYPHLEYDYVRPGIIMYGIHSSKDVFVKIKMDLLPVLSLKTRITSLKKISKDEYVSYGRTYKSTKETLIASAGIGYADGLPRSLSNKNLVVKINNSYGIIIGRICMDQILIDVSNIPDVQVGDIVEIIGDDENLQLTDIVYEIDTLTNEFLSRLGSRLEIVVKKQMKSI